MSSRHTRAWAIAVALAIGLCPRAFADDPQLTFDVHVNPSSKADESTGMLRIISKGGPVTVRSLTLNDRCIVSFYQESPPRAATNGDRMAWGLTDEKAPATIIMLHQHGREALPGPLIVEPDEPVSVLIPAVVPIAAFAGFPGSGACGMTLDSLHAITSIGQVDWQSPPP